MFGISHFPPPPSPSRLPPISSLNYSPNRALVPTIGPIRSIVTRSTPAPGSAIARATLSPRIPSSHLLRWICYFYVNVLLALINIESHYGRTCAMQAPTSGCFWCPSEYNPTNGTCMQVRPFSSPRPSPTFLRPLLFFSRMATIVTMERSPTPTTATRRGPPRTEEGVIGSVESWPLLRDITIHKLDVMPVTSSVTPALRDL